MNNPTEKREIIEQALQEAVGGGGRDLCGFECTFFSRDICKIDVCGTEEK